jgi:hypothetical protein
MGELMGLCLVILALIFDYGNKNIIEQYQVLRDVMLTLFETPIIRV